MSPRHALLLTTAATALRLAPRRTVVRMATTTEAEPKPKVVIVGGGWGGFGAALAAAENNCDVTLIDAGDPTEGMTTESGKPFEPGMRGFWKDYPNINKLGDELGIEGAYTDFTESSFFSPDGLECTAPVFSGARELPSPLGQVFASFDRFKRLPLRDRASIAGLLAAMLDFNRSPEIFDLYDRMTAYELFRRVGVTKRLVDDFLRPTLLVGLFKPPEELSAAVTMELLYFYALAHQTSFDVRWLARGTVQTTLLKPLADKLTGMGVVIKPKTFVTELTYEDDRVTSVKTSEGSVDCDAVVLALGAGGMKRVLASSTELSKAAPDLAASASLNAIDVVAVRLWLDRTVETDTPVGVFAKFPELRGAGGTFFMLDQLQKENLEELWGNDEIQGSVLSADFYNSGAIAPLSDEAIVELEMKLLGEAYGEFKNAKVVDSCVKRYQGAVSWFSPGSFSKRPPLASSVKNVCCAGDWVRMGDREHGAKGLCQERALVSGYEAANELASRGVLNGNRRMKERLEIRDDEPAYTMGVRASSVVQGALDRLGVGSAWVR